MIASGIGIGDEVICPSLSYIATANSIKYTGAVPVFAEVSSIDYNLDPVHAMNLINSKTKAILLVHQIGMPADIDVFKKICSDNNLKLIEDAACAIGSEYKGVKIGADSDLACFSFHPRKVMTTGEGGMITTSDKNISERIKLLRQHAISITGKERHSSETLTFEDHLEVGYNYRMTDIQASIGLSQLNKIEYIIKERRKIAARYISELDVIDSIKLPVEPTGRISNYQSFAIYIKKNSGFSRNEVMQKLMDKGISVRKGIMTSHREKAYSDHKQFTSLSVSEDICDNSFMIPLFVPMDDKDVKHIISSLKIIFSKK